MEGIYPVTLASEPVGKVFVNKQGLYYRFQCRCCLTGTVMYRVLACWDEHHQDLGILVPMEGDFGLDTRLPAKHFVQLPRRFIAVPRHGRFVGNLEPLSPKEPFAYINSMYAQLLQRREKK